MSNPELMTRTYPSRRRRQYTLIAVVSGVIQPNGTTVAEPIEAA